MSVRIKHQLAGGLTAIGRRTLVRVQSNCSNLPLEKSEAFPATAFAWKCSSLFSLLRHLPQFPLYWLMPTMSWLDHTYPHPTLQALFYCYLHPQLLLLLMLVLLLCFFLLLFLVLFSWSNISFWLKQMFLVMRDVVKETLPKQRGTN